MTSLFKTVTLSVSVLAAYVTNIGANNVNSSYDNTASLSKQQKDSIAYNDSLKDYVVHEIAKREGYVAKPYICPAGYLTIGYGHVIKDNERSVLTHLDSAEAIALLAKDIDTTLHFMQRFMKHNTLHEQYGATMLATSIGVSALLHYQVFKHITKRHKSKAVRNKWLDICKYYDKAGNIQTSECLLKSRKLEYRIYTNKRPWIANHAN